MPEDVEMGDAPYGPCDPWPTDAGGEAERFRGLEIDDELIVARLAATMPLPARRIESIRAAAALPAMA